MCFQAASLCCTTLQVQQGSHSVQWPYGKHNLTSASLTWKMYDALHNISRDVCMWPCYVLQKRRKFHCTKDKKNKWMFLWGILPLEWISFTEHKNQPLHVSPCKKRNQHKEKQVLYFCRILHLKVFFFLKNREKRLLKHLCSFVHTHLLS